MGLGIYRWQPVGGPGLEHLILLQGEDVIVAEGELRVAWIGVPALDVHCAPQGYTRLSDGRYRFEALGTGFEAVLEVDAEGLVLEYPALFRRVGAWRN